MWMCHLKSNTSDKNSVWNCPKHNPGQLCHTWNYRKSSGIKGYNGEQSTRCRGWCFKKTGPSQFVREIVKTEPLMWTVPWLKPSVAVASFSQQKPGLKLRAVHVGCVVDGGTLGQVFLRVLWLLPATNIPAMTQTNFSLTLAIESVVK
jgi:hypothetical protein